MIDPKTWLMKSPAWLYSIFSPVFYTILSILFAGAVYAQKKTDNCFMLLWYEEKKLMTAPC